MEKILIVEDEIELANVTKDYLIKEGYEVKIISDGKSAYEFLMKNEVSLVLLDIMLPNLDGYKICEEVRRKSDVPIIIASAKDSEDDKIIGLELGADDYVLKPYSVRELVARIKAQIRRIHLKSEKAKIIDGKLLIDSEARKVYLEGNEIELPVKEFELMKLLVENKGKVLKREKIFDIIWGANCYSEQSTLIVHINRIRDKFEQNPKKPEIIKTVWGVGYIYEGFK